MPPVPAEDGAVCPAWCVTISQDAADINTILVREETKIVLHEGELGKPETKVEVTVSMPSIVTGFTLTAGAILARGLHDDDGTYVKACKAVDNLRKELLSNTWASNAHSPDSSIPDKPEKVALPKAVKHLLT